MKFVRLLLLMALLLTACGTAGTTPGTADQAPSNAVKISIAYSPEKESWLTSRLEKFNQSNTKVGNRPIFVEGIRKSSGAARTEIKQGALNTTVWSPSSSVWLEVLKQETGNPNVAASSKPMLLTPVVISMWKPMAEALGWPNKQLGWSDLLALIKEPEGWGKYGHPEWGKFSWGHTDPEISTTALSTVLAEFYAATNKSRGLTEADVQAESSQQFLRDLSEGIKHYGYDTVVFSENMKKYGISYISAFPMEEITLIDFNKSAPPTPLVAIYPREGTFWHDNPFIVMATATQEEQEAAGKLYDFLYSSESQSEAMKLGFRPANTQVAIGEPISTQLGADPNQPQTLLEVPQSAVLVAAKNAWAANRKRANIVLVVDTSGSMRGDKIEEAKAGLELFLSRLLNEDRVAMITFSNTPEVVVPMGQLTENRLQLQGAIQNIEVNGQTAMYDALREARRVLEEDVEDSNRINAIVLLSDGADTAQTSTFDDVKNDFNETDISIFPIAYGEDAEKEVLQQIADFSRTLLISGGTGDINKVFENLSRYF